MKQNSHKTHKKRTRFFAVNVVTILRHILECGIDILRRKTQKAEMKQNETNETNSHKRAQNAQRSHRQTNIVVIVVVMSL